MRSGKASAKGRHLAFSAGRRGNSVRMLAPAASPSRHRARGRIRFLFLRIDYGQASFDRGRLQFLIGHNECELDAPKRKLLHEGHGCSQLRAVRTAQCMRPRHVQGSVDYLRCEADLEQSVPVIT